MKKSWKRSLSLLVAVIMVLAMLPANIFAAETTTEINSAAELVSGGNYKLTDDITLSDVVEINANTTLDLNGHTVYTTGGMMFKVVGGANETARVTFTLTDSGNGGTLQGNGTEMVSGEAAIVLSKYATLDMQGGIIAGFKGKTTSAVRIDQPTSKFIMSGGVITGNTTTNTSWGVVYNNRGTFEMTGGRIENSSSAYDVIVGSDANYGAVVKFSGDPSIGDVKFNTGNNWKDTTVTIEELAVGASIGKVSISGTASTVTITTDSTVKELDGVYTFKHICADANFDHICDNGCDVPQGEHNPDSTTHLCAYCNQVSAHEYDSNGYCACGKGDPAAVAQVGGQLYMSLEDAIDAALAAGTATVKVVKDTTMNKTVCVNPGEHLTIDLNGYRVTIAENAAAIKPTSGRQTYNSIFRLESSKEGKVAKLTITDTSAEKDGMFDGEGAEGIKNFVRIDQDGEFYLEGGTITNVTGSAAGAVVTTSKSGAKFEMSGGKITGNTATYATKGVIVYAYLGTFNMTGGEISGNTPADGYSDVERNSGSIAISGSAKLESLATAATLGALTKGARIVSKVSLTPGEGAEGTFKREVVDGKYVYTYIVSHTKQNVRLQDLIKVGFYFTAPANAESVGALVWTKEAYEAEANRTATNEDANYPVGQNTDGSYVVETAGVKAQNLDQVYVMIPYAVIGGEYVYGDAQEYSALDYAKKAYESTDPELADARTLIIDLLNYGTAARNYFYTRDGKIDNAAPLNSILSAADKEVNWDSATMSRYYAAGTTDGTLNIDRYGRSASLLEAIQLNVFYTGDSFSAAKYWLDAADKQDAIVSAATVNGQAMTKVSIPNIYSFNIYDDYSLQPVEGDAVGNTTVTSVAAYLTKVVDSNNDAACVALAKAMMVYGFHADAIFNQ